MRVLVAMSGGVDSSVAAKLLVSEGNECIGCTMRLFDNEDAGISQESTCCSLKDVNDAKSVSYKLGMPYYVFNFKDGFKEKVMDKFVDSYLRGMTPNPCIDCNKYMKFDKLYERAVELSCDHIATGHYARIEKAGDKYLLKKALDETKDQSYVLYSLTQNQLAHTLFPLGELKKTETRKIAEENGFVNANKPDSQDICFVPDGDYASIIEMMTGNKSKPGNFVDTKGKVLGRHKGIINYTIGQHKGLGLSLPYSMYVKRIDVEKNEVVLCDEKELFEKDVYVEDFNWISGTVPSEPVRCKAKIRYRQQEKEATVTPVGENRIHIHFDEPQRAVTPGQSAVLYDGDVVLGGGTIVKSDN